MYTVFCIFFSIMVYHRISNIVPCAIYSRTLLFIHSICNSLRLLTPNSQSVPPRPPLPLGNHKSVLYVGDTFNWHERKLSRTYRHMHSTHEFLHVLAYLHVLTSSSRKPPGEGLGVNSWLYRPGETHMLQTSHVIKAFFTVYNCFREQIFRLCYFRSLKVNVM